MVRAMMNRWLLASYFAIIWMAGSLCAQTPALETPAIETPALETAAGSRRANLAWKSLGGEQFWTDELVYGRWRIQRNEFTEHHRLLDPANVRRAWGTEEECRAALEMIKWRKTPPTFRPGGRHAARAG